MLMDFSQTAQNIFLSADEIIGTATSEKIFSPAKGYVLPISLSADRAHQKEAIGKGICIMPADGKICAPCDGTVALLFRTNHAINIISANGAEIFIHCGIETMSLCGKGFAAHAHEGDAIKAGQLLLEFDRNIVKRSGHSTETQMVILNSADYNKIVQAKAGNCAIGDLVLYIE